MKLTKRLFALLLSLFILIGVAPMGMIHSDAATYSAVSLNVPWYSMRHASGCGISSIAMVEGYFQGYGDNNSTCYDAVYNTNKAISPSNPVYLKSYADLGYSTISNTLEAVYNELKNGNPVIVYRTGSNLNHYSVIYGYNGSTTTLQKSGFKVKNTYHDSSYSAISWATAQKQGFDTNLEKWLSGATWAHTLKRIAKKISIPFGSSTSDPTWVLNSVANLSQTDARISTKVTFSSKITCTSGGFYLGTDKNNLKKNGKPDSCNISSTYIESGFTMSAYGEKLQPGTTYYYKVYVVADGKTYTSPIGSFTTKSSSAAPTKSTISMSKNRIVAGDSITFTFGSDTATQYSLGIDAQDGTRVLTSSKQAGTTYTYTCNEVGLYSAYVTASNDKGYKDSSRVYFQVISDTPTFVNSVEANGHTYEMYLAAITWEDAKVWCEDNGGHLVTITSSDEQAVVENLLGNHKSGCYWFGGEEKTGTYRWVTDELWEYENWPADGSEPNRSVDANGQREQYLGNYHGTTWNDYTNASTTLCGFVMETDPTEEITDVELSADSFVYNGSLQYPEVIARNMAGDVLTEGVDYDVTYFPCFYLDLDDAPVYCPGICSIDVYFTGRYTGHVSKTYIIEEQPLKSSNITLSWTDATYNGAVQKPTVMVKNAEGEELEQDTDYSISYSADSKAPGSYTVTVTGKGNYTGTVTKTYTITKQPLVASNITLSWTSKAYNGSVQKPTVTIKNANGVAMKPDIQYKVSYSADSKAPGTYTVTVTGVGYYTGTVTKTFTIK